MGAQPSETSDSKKESVTEDVSGAKPSTNFAGKDSSNSALESVEDAKSSSKDFATCKVSGDESDTELFVQDRGSKQKGKRALPDTCETTPKPKRQKKNPKSKASAMTTKAKPKRKTGWRASEDSGKNCSATERKAKQGIWAEKLARCKNAFAKQIVENAFSAETPVKWKGTRYTQRPAIEEKKVMYRSFNSAGDANVSA